MDFLRVDADTVNLEVNMIELDVLDVCENCLLFRPVLADELVLTTFSDVTVFHRVTCEDMEKCKMLKENLRKALEKNES